MRGYQVQKIVNLDWNIQNQRVNQEILGVSLHYVQIHLIYSNSFVLFTFDYPISHGSSVTFTTLKYVAIEQPLTFYGILGFIFVYIGLFLDYGLYKFFPNKVK